jgi:hypothetical protein
MTNLHVNFIINIDFILRYLLEAHKSDPQLVMIATSTVRYNVRNTNTNKQHKVVTLDAGWKQK